MAHLIKYNPIIASDSYKFSHFLQYPATTGFVSSYVESRGGRWPLIMFSGLQSLLMDWEACPITMEMIDEAEWYAKEHGVPFNRPGWELIVNEFDGKLPVTVQALPEGQIVPTGVPLVQVINNDDRLLWLVSYLETDILRHCWYSTTVGTLGWYARRMIIRFLDKTSDVPESIDFMLHDFGARGASSAESAMIAGTAHLINFKGTDTFEALRYANTYYDAGPAAGFSVVASEHSTATSFGPGLGEELYVEKMMGIDSYIISMVSDSYDVFNFVENIICGTKLDLIKNSGKRAVIRPDSGDPVTVIGQIFKILGDKLADDITTNSKGYKVLPDYIRVLQGDGVNEEAIKNILTLLMLLGWSSENIVFGMGGELHSKVNRDTQRFAMKASAAQYDDQPWMEIFKDPITDPGKRSKKGRLGVIRTEEDQLMVTTEALAKGKNELVDVFKDGKVLRKWTFDEVRALAEKGW